MLVLMIGAAVLAAPSLIPDHHGAVMRAAGVDLQRRPSRAAWSEGPSGGQLDLDDQSGRIDVQFATASRWGNEDAVAAGRIALVHGLERYGVGQISHGSPTLPVSHLDPRNAQDEIAGVGATVHDPDVQMPIDIGGERLRPAGTLAYGSYEAAREDRTVERAGVVDEALGTRDERRNGTDTTSNQTDHSEEAQRGWSGMQTALGALMVLASIVIGVCLIVLLVVLFEFIPGSEERVWPVRIARTAVVANLVLALAFAAFIHIG